MKHLKKNINDSFGFSLMELMTVIAIVSVLSAIGIPSFYKNLPEKRLKGAARNLYADLQKARLLSIRKNKDLVVRFDEDGEYYYIDDDKKDKAGYKTWEPDEFRRDLAEYGGVIYGKGVAVKNWNKNPINRIVPFRDIKFTTKGTATSASTYLQSQNNGEICYAVTVTNFGAVKIRKFGESGWE